MRTLIFVGLLASAAGLASTAGIAQPVMPAPAVGPMVSPGGPVMAPVFRGPMVSARGPIMAAPMVSANGPMMARGPMVSPGGPVMNRWGWGHRVNGRWWGGVQAPGGWAAYRRPTAGFILPGYWLQPGYYLSDYGAYGLPAPPAGHGWSRYYDDAVLTDEYGKVYDSRIGYDWDRHGGYDDGPRYRDEDYDRRDDRRIAKEERKQQRKLEKVARKAGYPSYAAYLRARNQRAMAHAPTPPHWAVRGGPEDRHGDGPVVTGAGGANVQTYTTPGHVAGGYYYPGTTVTTITLEPSVTKTTTTTYTTVAAKPARARTKILKRRGARCAC